eukprot:6204553-Pleurochrysis_carterae.AAC.1
MNEAQAETSVQVTPTPGPGVLWGLVWSRPAIGSFTWPSSLTAKRPRATLACAAFAIRSFVEAAAQLRDAILKKLVYCAHSYSYCRVK